MFGKRRTAMSRCYSAGGPDSTSLHPAAVRLVDLDAPDRLRSVGPAQQLFPNRRPVLLQVDRQFANSHAVHARTALVGLDLDPQP